MVSMRNQEISVKSSNIYTFFTIEENTMSHLLNDKVYVVADKSIAEGRVRSVRTTSYTQFNAKGVIETRKFVQYSIHGVRAEWHHDNILFRTEESAKAYLDSVLRKELEEVQRRLKATQ